MMKKNSKAFKKLIREHMARMGMKYEAAMRDLERQSAPDQGRTLAELLSALSAPRAPLVMLSDVLAVGASADLEIARQQARALARLRLRKAESGQAGAIVSRLEEERLIRAGAADGNRMKIIRAFSTDRGPTFSAQCPSCSRWIHCWNEERDAICHCGQEYRVAFDAPADASLKMGLVCMDCGHPFQLTERGSGLNPWRPINAWQTQCNLCRGARANILRMCQRWGADGPTTGYRNPNASIVVAADRLAQEGLLTSGWTFEENVRLLGLKLTTAGVEYLRQHPQDLEAA